MRLLVVLVCAAVVVGASRVVVDPEGGTEAAGVEVDVDVEAAEAEPVQQEAATDTDTNHDTLTANIEAELEATDALIAALTAKVEVLSRWRMLAGSDPAAAARVLNTARLASRTDPDATMSFDLPPMGGAPVGAASSFPELFVSRGKVQPDAAVTAVHFVGIRMRTGAAPKRGASGHLTQLLIVGLSSGAFKVYSVTGSLLAEVSLGDGDAGTPQECAGGAPVSMSSELSDDPFLTVLWDNGCVSLHRFALWLNARKLHFPRGWKPSRERMDAAKDTPTGLVVDEVRTLVLPPSLLDSQHEGVGAPGAGVTVAAAFGFRSILRVVVAHDNGVLGVYDRNGTRTFSLLPAANSTSLQADNGDALPITALTHHGSLIAFAAGHHVGFVNMVRMVPVRTMCAGPLSPIISLTFDAFSPAIVWAGTAAGDVLAFNSRTKVEGTNDFRCAVVYRSAAPDPNPATVVAARGYSVSVTSSQIAVHNATEPGNGVSLVLREAFQAAGQGQPLVAVSRGGTRQSSPEVFVAFVFDTGVTVFESLLPYTHSVTDFMWIRTPIMILGIGAVLLYQVYRRRSSSSARKPRFDEDEDGEMQRLLRGVGGGGRGDRGGRGGSSAQEDLARMMRQFEAEGRQNRVAGDPDLGNLPDLAHDGFDG